jgi:hypothetical protein
MLERWGARPGRRGDENRAGRGLPARIGKLNPRKSAWLDWRVDRQVNMATARDALLSRQANWELGSPAGSGSGSATGGQVLRCRVSALPVPHCPAAQRSGSVGAPCDFDFDFDFDFDSDFDEHDSSV